MRMIDADALKEYISNEQGLTAHGAVVFKEIVNEQPTVDPVRHGHWIFNGSLPDKCSACGFMCGSHDQDNADRYCSHCGARMD